MVPSVIKGVINNYRFSRVKGGEVCLLGENGFQSTEIEFAHCDTQTGRKFVKTRSGSVYELGHEHVSLWRFPLQIHLPQKYASLVACGVV